MPEDQFRQFSRSLTAPPENAVEITPHDTNPLDHATRAVHVGGEGNLRVRMVSGDVVTLSGLAAGSMVPIRVSQVFATGTTATAVVGLW